MIFLHRQNTIGSGIELVDGVEVDVRSTSTGLVMEHDCINYAHHYPRFEDMVDLYCSLNKQIIFNIKESGIEEEIIRYMEDKPVEWYFLDSQIPDILKISKNYPEHSHRFILRISDVESLNFAIIDRINPTFIWLDYSLFHKFDRNNYLFFVNSCVRQIRSHTQSNIILVSPELYSLDYLDITKSITNRVKALRLDVCTKFPELYRE